MGNAVVHFEVMGQDGARLRQFYSDLFGWRIDADNPMEYGVIAHSENHGKGGVGIGGGVMGGMEPGQDGVTFYVEVDDIAATLERVEQLGGTRIMGPEQVPGGPTFGHLKDPEGHWIGLMQTGSLGPAATIDPDAAPQGSPVVHFEVIGRDAATLQAFYGELFGWKFDTNNPVGYGVISREDNLNRDGIGIGGGMMALPQEMVNAGETGHVTWYVEVPDVGAALSKAQQLGGQPLNGPMEVPGGPTLGQLADPEGHLIGVVQAEAD